MVQIACPCPPPASGEIRHPDGDDIELKPKLGFVEAAAVRNAVALRRAAAGEELETDEILAVLTEGYIIQGTASWTLADDDGPIPVTRANIRTHILERWDIASVVADAADELYAEAVMLPLLSTASTSSRPSQTPESTSPSPGSGTPAPRPSKPSSISTIPTVDTAKTTSSPDGDSRSSRSSTSAA